MKPQICASPGLADVVERVPLPGDTNGYETYVLVSNASTTEAAQIRVAFLVKDGEPIVRTFTVPPKTRFNVVPHEHISTTGGTVRFGTIIESLNGVPISAEMSIYWNAVGPAGELRRWAGGINLTATPLP